MYPAFPTILTSIALNILNKVGVEQSFVFAPLPILLSLADYPDAASNHIFNGIPSLNTTLFFEQANITETQYNMRPPYLQTEPYLHPKYYSLNEPTNSNVRKFNKAASRVENWKFISLDFEVNKYLSCKKEGARMAKDDYFEASFPKISICEVLELLIAEEPLRFVAFLPTNESYLSESLHKLDTTRFHELLGKLDFMFVDFKIPYFELKTRIDLSALLGISSNAHHEYELKFPRQLFWEVDTTAFPRRPCETERYDFEVNRPFLFSVLNGTTPLVMGLFTGKNN